MKTAIFAVISLLLTGCGLYKSQFDSKPGKGIGCAPVSDVLDMIIESEHGSDAFVTNADRAKILKRIEAQRKQKPNKPGMQPQILELKQDAEGNLRLMPIKER